MGINILGLMGIRRTAWALITEETRALHEGFQDFLDTTPTSEERPDTYRLFSQALQHLQVLGGPEREAGIAYILTTCGEAGALTWPIGEGEVGRGGNRGPSRVKHGPLAPPSEEAGEPEFLIPDRGGAAPSPAVWLEGQLSSQPLASALPRALNADGEPGLGSKPCLTALT